MHGKLRTSFSLLHRSNIRHNHVYAIRPIHYTTAEEGWSRRHWRQIHIVQSCFPFDWDRHAEGAIQHSTRNGLWKPRGPDHARPISSFWPSVRCHTRSRIPRFTAFVSQEVPTICLGGCRTVLTTSHGGWEPIGFNWIHPRRKSYGVLPVDDSTRFQLRQSVYAQPLSSPPPLFETLVCS